MSLKYNKLYGPYSSKEDALSQLPIIEGEFNTKITDRYIGLTIGIKNSNRNEDIDEYWFKDGIQDNNLVKKNIEDITELKLNNEQITDTTFTKYSEFNQLFDNGTIKLDKLPNDLRDINATISNKINNSDELKGIIDDSITNSDTLNGIVSNSISSNTIIQGLQGKFSDGKLDTLVSNLTDANGKFKLPDNVVLDTTLESKIPDNIKAISNNFEYNNGNLTIKDGSVLTTTFAKQTEVNGLISEQVSGLLNEGNETFQNAVVSAIGNGDVVNNAISSNTIIKGLQGKFDTDGKLVNTVLPTGLQQFTSKLSNDGKLATLDVLPTGVITTENIENNTIVKGLQNKFDTDGKLKVDNLILPTDVITTENIENNTIVQNLQSKFDSNGNLVNTFLPTSVITKTNLDSNLPENVKNLSNNSSKLTNLASKLDDNGKINSLDILPTTELTDSILTTDNINSKLPQGIKDFTEKLTNDGKLDITNLVDGITPITKDTFAKKEELSSLSTEFTNLSTVVITTENIKDNDIVKGLQGKFDSDGKLVNTVLPTGLQKFTSKLSNDGKLSTLDVLPTGVITSNNINDNLPDSVARKDDLFDNGKLKDTYIPTTLATNDALNNLSNSVVLQTDDTYTSLKGIKDNLTILSSIKDEIIDENNNVKFATYDNIKSGLLSDTDFNNGIASNITEDINNISPDTIANNIITNKSAELIGTITSNSNFMTTLANNDDLTNKIINNNDFGREILINNVKETLISYGESELSETLTDRTTAINSYGEGELSVAKTNRIDQISNIDIKPEEVAEKINTDVVAEKINLNNKIDAYVELNGISKTLEVETQITNATKDLVKKSDFNTLQTNVGGLQTIVANKADSYALTTLNSTVSGLQGKFNADGKLKVDNLILPTDVVLKSTLDEQLPDNIKAIRDNFEFNDGNLTIKDGSVLTTTFTKQTDVNDLISQEVSGLLTEGNQTFQDAVESAIGNGDVVNNAISSNTIIQGLQTSVANKADSSTLSSLQTSVDGLQGTVRGLETTVASKADSSALSSLQTSVDGLQGTVRGLETTVASKADSSALSSLQTTVASKADSSVLFGLQGTVRGLETTVASKADSSTLSSLQTSVDGLQGTVRGLETTVASKADSSALNDLQEIAITTNNFNSKIPTGLQKFTSKLDDNGDLDLINLKLNGNVITQDTLALSTDIPTVQKLLEDETLVSSINEKITHKMQGEEFEGIVNDAISKSSSLQGIVQNGIDNNDIVKGLQGTVSGLQGTVAQKADSSVLNSLRNIAITTENINDNLPANVKELSNNSSKLTNLAINLSNDGKLASLDVLPTGVITTDNIKDNDIVNGLQGTISGLQDTVASKADSSALNDLSNNVVLQNDLNGKITAYVNANDISKNSDVQNQIINVKTELNSSLAKKANSSDLTSLNSTVTTLQSKFNSSQIGPRNAGFVNIETDTTVTDYSDLVKTSINGARIPATMVQSSIAGTETGYYYFLCDSVVNIPSTDRDLKINNSDESTNEDYNYVYIINSQKEEYIHKFNNNFIDYISNLNNSYLNELYNNIINELKMNGQNRLLTELNANLSKNFELIIKDDGDKNYSLYEYDKKHYNDLENVYINIQNAVNNYQYDCYRLNIINYINQSYNNNKDFATELRNTFTDVNEFITTFNNLVNIIINEKTAEVKSKFYENNIDYFDKFPRDVNFNYDIIFTYDSIKKEYNNEYLITFLTLIKLINEDRDKTYLPSQTLDNIINNDKINKLIAVFNNIIGNMIKYDINNNIITQSNNYYYILENNYTKNYFQTVIQQLEINAKFNDQFFWDNTILSETVISWVDVNFQNIKHYICINNAYQLLPYTLSFDNKEQFIDWLNELKTGSDNYTTKGYDESKLKYFGTSEQVGIMLSCYTYEIIPDVDNNNSITTKIYENEVISYIRQSPKTQTIYLAFDNDNGWKYFYRQYIWDGNKVLKFKEDLLYEVQYSTPTINTLRGNIENQQENINTITQDSEYNLESIAQTLNGLIDDLLLIKGSLNLSSEITSQLKVLQGVTQKMTYDSVTKRYQSNVITTTSRLNPSLNVEQIQRTFNIN